MKILHQPENDNERGFIYVASLSRIYYHFAVYSALTLKDYYPGAKITLFTHESFLDKDAAIFDTVIVDIPIYYRTKMWAMARSPYQKTIYIDSDSQIVNRKIKTMHNLLNDCDMFFGPVTSYTVSDMAWAYMDKAMTIKPRYHGGMCGYNKSELVVDFLNTWYNEYIKQICTPNWPYEKHHDKKWKIFDMFTLWRMTNKKNSEFDRFNQLNIKLVDRQYTSTASHLESDRKDAVILQIDKHTYKKTELMKQKMEEADRNAIYTIKEYPINKPPTKYN